MQLPLQEVATLQRGFDLPSRSRKPGDVPIVSSAGISDWHGSYKVAPPGVVTGRYGTIGEVFFLNQNFWPLNTTLWVSDFHGNCAKYVYYLLQTIDYRSHSGKSGVPGVNRNDLHSEIVSIPTSVTEQKHIAEVLSDSDDLIQSLERFISKKRAIKQGMMQELLTGRTRLPGFSASWFSSTWGELALGISSGATPRRGVAEYWNGEIPWVTSTELKRGPVDSIPQSITTAGLRAANLRIWPAGTFLMAITGLEAAGTRGKCGLLSVAAATNHSCMAVAPGPDLDTEFLFYYYLHYGNDLAFKYVQGTKQQSYTAAIVKKLPIHLPSDVSEQQAIAQVLRDADHEIAALERCLESARNIKQGMMQELLTGRTRLPFEGESA